MKGGKMKIDLTSRKFLNALEYEAWKHSEIKGINEFWASVYKRLAEVSCELDAYIARSTVEDIEDRNDDSAVSETTVD